LGTGIHGQPNDYNFGLDFNYSLWTPGTSVDLVNVQWDNNYRDVVRFANKAALNAHIDGLAPAGITINQLSYVKPGEPVRVNIPHTRALKYNYLRASNPLQPIADDELKVYYYFILDARYIAPNTTELVLQLDIFQTYGYDVTFGNCYIERGHIGIANENAFDNYGRDYLTVPEGFDLGGEYRTIAKRSDDIMGVALGESSIAINYDVLVVSTVDLSADPGTAAAPNLKSATGTYLGLLVSGADMYVFDDITGFVGYMDSISEAPWVSQGIISATIIPKFTRYDPDFEYQPLGTPTPVSSYGAVPKLHQFFNDWRNSSELLNQIDAKYRHLRKFFTYPYMAIQMTTWTATPIVLKPESWGDSNAYVMERSVFMPPGQRVEFTPRRYNSSGQQIENLYNVPDSFGISQYNDRGDDSGDYLDIATMIANFPTLPIVNNGQLGYLASNVNGIAYQRSSADWTQQRAVGNAQGQYDIQTSAMHAMMDLSGSGVNADIANTANLNRTQAAQAAVTASGQFVQGVGQALTPSGFLGSAISGAAQAAQTGIHAGIGIGSNDEGLAIRNRLAAEQVQTQNKQAGVTRDVNNDLAKWSAKGDYSNAIAGVNARVQDAALIQPTTSGQMGGETINLANGTAEVSLRWKLIDNAAIRRIGDYWLRYGYAIRAFITMPSSLMVMSKFTYWKLNETYIVSAAIPESHKQTLRGIFEKGVTVWADPNDIGQIDLWDNIPLEGISY